MLTELKVEGQVTDWRIFGVAIEGETPLLMHSPQRSMSRDDGAAKRKNIPDPEEEAEAALYRTEDGYLYLGADHMRQALLNAASGLRVQKKSLRQLAAAALQIAEPSFIITRNGVPLTTYDRIDIRRAVVQRQGILRARPVIEVPWAVDARFLYDASILNPANLVMALSIAGQTIGVLDYRPQKGGSFGRFRVVRACTEDV